MLRFRDKHTGQEHWSRVSAAPVHDARGQVVYAINVFRDVTEVMRTQERLALLAEAGELLSASLDMEGTLAAIARLLVPRLADWCAVHLAGDSTPSRQVASIHMDPAKVELARCRTGGCGRWRPMAG